MTRQEANMKILDMLEEYFIYYPDSRFNQAIVNFKLYPLAVQNSAHWYEESESTLKRLDSIARDLYIEDGLYDK